MNKLDVKNKIYWNNYGSDTYLYGSSVILKEDGVVFENNRMATSVVINTWSSKTNYQAFRKTPQLPLLQKNEKYKITFDMEIEPANTIYSIVEIYDRYDKIIKTKTFKKLDGVFKYPKEGYYYAIKLQNAGSESFYFRNFVIENYSDEMDE